MKIALIGYGKMGKAIEEIALEKGHEIVLKIDLKNQHLMKLDNLSKAEVAIEFTGPESAYENIKTCLEAGIPVVAGSTGWIGQMEEIKSICKEKKGCFLYASNFSIGVNLFFELNRKMAELMKSHPEYDVSLEEIHHTQKKDAPSGTAISLAKDILSSSLVKKKWVNQESDRTEDLSIISKRIDPAPGTHSVKYSSAIDDIEIIHTAHSRKGFAAGAVLAAEFVVGKQGIFSMKEVLAI